MGGYYVYIAHELSVAKQRHLHARFIYNMCQILNKHPMVAGGRVCLVLGLRTSISICTFRHMDTSRWNKIYRSEPSILQLAKNQ